MSRSEAGCPGFGALWWECPWIWGSEVGMSLSLGLCGGNVPEFGALWWECP